MNEVQEVEGEINSQTSEQSYALNAFNQNGDGGRRKTRPTIITAGIHLVTE
jgi:hypothetical protein